MMHTDRMIFLCAYKHTGNRHPCDSRHQLSVRTYFVTAEVTCICIAGETATSAIAEHMELRCLQKASVATLQCVHPQVQVRQC